MGFKIRFGLLYLGSMYNDINNDKDNNNNINIMYNNTI